MKKSDHEDSEPTSITAGPKPTTASALQVSSRGVEPTSPTGTIDTTGGTVILTPELTSITMTKAATVSGEPAMQLGGIQLEGGQGSLGSVVKTLPGVPAAEPTSTGTTITSTSTTTNTTTTSSTTTEETTPPAPSSINLTGEPSEVAIPTDQEAG